MLCCYPGSFVTLSTASPVRVCIIEQSYFFFRHVRVLVSVVSYLQHIYVESTCEQLVRHTVEKRCTLDLETHALSLTMAVDELHKALAELDELERQERHLVERLSEIRKAIEAQKLKIDDLGPTTINRLPPELLSQIFTLCIQDPKYPEKPLHRIVGVSRRWRDVVWNNPSFWTSIKVTQIQCKKSLKKQLERSRKAFLDIWIGDWDYNEKDDALDKPRALLAAIFLHANRWRSLTIDTDSMSTEFVESILTELNHLSVTSLREFSMIIWDDIGERFGVPYPDFLSPTRTPALQHLALKQAFPLVTFMALHTLKTLHLNFEKADRSPPVISMLTPAQSLTSLVLDGDSTGWSLKRDDLHLPLLDHLTLNLNNPVPFLEAIVAPKLRYFRCWFYEPMEFDTIEGKFRNTHDLFLEVDDWGAESLCRAFPGARRVKLSAWSTSFFMAGIHGSAGDLERRPPIDQWPNLETVTIGGLSRLWLDRWELDDPIVKWLRGRQESGLSRLCVRLLQIEADNDRLSTYYALLGRYCNLEILP